MADGGPEPGELARLYDLDLSGDQPHLDMYLALAAASDGAVLELAAGTGRLAVPLAQAGHRVTAVDRDPQMLSRARAHWSEWREAANSGQTSGVSAGVSAGGSLETIEADITALELDRRFGLVVLALNTLLMLPGREAQLAALSAMAGHLAPDGRAVIDVWLPGPDDLELYDGRLSLDWLRQDEQTGRSVAKLFSARYDAAHATARVLTIFDSWPAPGGGLRRVSREDELWLLSAHELLAMTRQAGLVPTVVGGDYGLGGFGTGSERLVLVCGLL
jgi:SAM-dependent methyltransferase